MHGVCRMVAEIGGSLWVGYGVNVSGFESHQEQDVETDSAVYPETDLMCTGALFRV
jgi:hypothetical protein